MSELKPCPFCGCLPQCGVDFYESCGSEVKLAAIGELIRCKDCKHYDTHDHRCKQWNHGVVVADYCSRAEKKGEA